jgi:hypothetical protein
MWHSRKILHSQQLQYKFFEEWQIGYNVFLGVRQLVSLLGSTYVQWQSISTIVCKIWQSFQHLGTNNNNLQTTCTCAKLCTNKKQLSTVLNSNFKGLGRDETPILLDPTRCIPSQFCKSNTC